ncbi:T9SS type A sorting domain-containing protein [Flavisericum labens]|uniref:T9SS type A sorting domain-containing protein n=1 Tax=Flavisericum labens TaxID=3377112 RepID=UPI00387ADC97
MSSSNNSKYYNIEIYDFLGKLKISGNLITESVNVESLSKGFYFLLIKDDEGCSVTKKFIK